MLCDQTIRQTELLACMICACFVVSIGRNQAGVCILHLCRNAACHNAALLLAHIMEQNVHCLKPALVTGCDRVI